MPRTQPMPLLEALQICVPLFLFMSGFGLYKVFEKDRCFTYSKSFQRTLNLYKRYWIILAIFIPVQFIFHDRVFNWYEFFLNVPALISSYL